MKKTVSKSQYVYNNYISRQKWIQTETRPTSPKTKTILRPFSLGLEFLNEAEKSKNNGNFA